jgi:hypothetical protein
MYKILLSGSLSAILSSLYFNSVINMSNSSNSEMRDLVVLSKDAEQQIDLELDLDKEQYVCLIKAFANQYLVLHFVPVSGSQFLDFPPRLIKIGSHYLPLYSEYEFQFSSRFNREINGAVETSTFLFHRFLYVEYQSLFLAGSITEMKWYGKKGGN